MKTHNFIIAIIILVNISCESTIQNFKIPEPEPKLVLHAFFGSDSIPKVVVTRNLKLAQDVELNYQTGAEVGIYRANELLTTLSLNDETSWFESPNLTFEENRNYFIRASNEGFPDVEAPFYIPEKPEIISIDTQFITAKPTDCFECDPIPYLQFSIKFTNPVGSDYYSVEIINETFEEIYEYSDDYNEIENIDTALIKRWIDISTNAPYIQTSFDGWYYNLQQPEPAWGYKFYFSDELLEDGENELVFDATLYSFTYNSELEEDINDITIKFRKIDEYLFYYVQSKGKNYDAEDNPFVEPVSIYTNVENGLGLVSGYSEYSKTFDVRDIFNKINIGTYSY